MPFLFVTQEQAEMLRSIVKAWPRLGPRLDTLLAMIEPKAVELRASSAPRTAPAAEVPTLPGGGWFKIKSNTSIGTNQWNYKGRLMKSGDATAITGLVETTDTTQFDLRNANESVALGGLTGIASLTAIATDSVVYAHPEIRNGVRVYVFERQNDIVCNASSSPVIITEDTELMAGETLALVDATAGPITITLAATSEADVPGTQVVVKKIDSSANAVTIVPAGSETIDGASSRVLSTQYAYVATVPDDTNYYIISEP